jgi:BASS family bile acid:Na+ symporter
MQPHPIDQAQLNFDPGTLLALNIILGLIMFGVALDLKVEDFKVAFKKPRAPLIGLTAQFLVLPAATFALSRIIDPVPSIALGMILVGSCPGGNISNFITHVAKGDTALSVSITAISTVGATFMTPINFSFWGSMHPETAKILTDLSLDPLQMLGTVMTVLGVPLVLGMTVAAKYPKFAEKARKPFKIMSLVFFAGLVVVAFQSNFNYFLAFISMVFIPVFLQNAMALATGYGAGKLVQLEEPEARALGIEVGIQNSGLGLVLIFTFMGGLGGMAVTAAWWGIWHILAGLTLAYFWSRRSGKSLLEAPSEGVGGPAGE